MKAIRIHENGRPEVLRHEDCLRGSLSVSRPAFSTYIEEPGEFQAASAELFDLVKRSVLKVEISHRYALRDVAEAHRDLEGRKYAGSLILVPGLSPDQT